MYHLVKLPTSGCNLCMTYVREAEDGVPGFRCEPLLATLCVVCSLWGEWCFMTFGPLFCELTSSNALVSHGCAMRLTFTNINHLHVSKCALGVQPQHTHIHRWDYAMDVVSWKRVWMHIIHTLTINSWYASQGTVLEKQ